MSEQLLPRAAAINDISGFGKCSLTVALPVLSACGVGTACLPTAVLSTHTGGIKGYTFRDLTEDMRAFYQHWLALGIHFDALYSGYLGSVEQADIVAEMFAAFKKQGSLLLVDPAMADHGRYYAMLDQRMARGQARLCAMADVIVPNLTEAAFLLGEEYRPGICVEKELRSVCERLCALGAKAVVLTGVHFDQEELGACCFDSATGAFDVYLTPRVPGAYHGTGDVYASVLLGGLLNGKTLPESMALAADFVYESLVRTRSQGTDERFGVDFEHGLALLSQRMLRREV